VVQVPEEEDSDEDDYVYNPLKLPMGPDGKPIPYWLYKLHGLNQARHMASEAALAGSWRPVPFL